MTNKKYLFRVEGKMLEDGIYIEAVRDYEADSNHEASDLAMLDGLIGRSRLIEILKK